MLNQKIVLARFPKGHPAPDDFALTADPVPALKTDEFLVRTIYLGIEPRQRLILNPTKPWNAAMRPHGGMADIGRVVPGTVLGEVIDSKNAAYPVGAIVEGFMGWQSHIVTNGAPHPTNNPEGVAICDRSLDVPIAAFAAGVGLPGLTAFLALRHEGKLNAGETMVVTSAAGLVGSIAGQLGKREGATVIGVTSSQEKINYLLNDLKFDGAINYRETKDLAAAVAALLPQGVDYYFDNVGGPIAAQVKSQLTSKGRVTRCGIVSSYNETEWEQARLFAGQFSVHDHVPEYKDARRRLANLLNEGALKYDQRIFQGLASAPEALRGVLESKNIGKWLVQVGPLPAGAR